MSKYDVALIGSGISALTCAAILAKKGKSVCVLEKYSKPGGYLHGFKRFGHHFDTGAHYVGAMREGQPFRQLLDYLGVYDESLFVPLDQDAFDVLYFPEMKVELPQGYENISERLKSLFPHDVFAIDTFFKTMREAVAHFQTYKFQDKVDQEKLSYFVNTPLSKIVEPLTSNESLKIVLYAHCLLHGVKPTDVPFGMHSIMMDSFITGAHGLRNGGDALAQKFVKVIEAFGGRVFLKKNVSKIYNEGAWVRQLETSDGEIIQAELVISAIHPKLTFSLLSDSSALRPVFKERLGSLKESAASFGVYAEVNSPELIHPLSNHFYFENQKLEGLFDVPLTPQKPRAVFANVAKRVVEDKNHKQAIKLLAVGPYEWFKKWEKEKIGHRGADYEDFKASYASQLWSVVDQYVSGASVQVTHQLTSSALSNIYFNGSPEGSGYGLYHSLSVTGPRAIGPRTHLRNLLITGQSTLFPGFLGAATAGIRAAGNVVGTKEILDEIHSET